MKVYEFDATIIKVENMDAAYIDFPYDVEKEFGARGQVKVKASFDGVEYRGSLAKMGHNCHRLGMTKAIRKEINKGSGDTVHVILVKDDAPRVVRVSEDLRAQLDKNDAAKSNFEKLSYTNQKKITEWIKSAKKEETRERRVRESIVMLTEGKVR